MDNVPNNSHKVLDTLYGLEEVWYDSTGLIHRDNGLPAVIGETGYEAYYNHNSLVWYRQEDEDHEY